jgi:hypothetical protein
MTKPDNQLTVRRVVAILKKLPEKRLAIFDLAPQLVDEQGKVDVGKCLEHQPDINLAIAEVTAYVEATKAARHALGDISALPDDDDDDLDDDDDEEAGE